VLVAYSTSHRNWRCATPRHRLPRIQYATFYAITGMDDEAIKRGSGRQ
jgi:hypothetical protein